MKKGSSVGSSRTATYFLAMVCLIAGSAGALAQESRKMEGSVHRGGRSAEAAGERRADFARAIRRMERAPRGVSLRSLRLSESRPQVRKPGLAPVGVTRSLPEDTLVQGEWSVSGQGTAVWRVRLHSPDAEAIRVRFRNFQVGQGAVWLFGSDGESTPAGPYTDRGPHGDGEFWSDLVPGDSATIAYEPAPGEAASGTPPFAATELSHRFRAASPKAAEGGEQDVRLAAAASCTVDISCFPEYGEPASGVALILFESGGSTYQCSGALLSSASQPALPFFLTANHCVSTAEEARSVIAFFNYQTPNCNGTPPALGRMPRVLGSQLLAGEAIERGDFTLLQLTAFPAVDVKLLGWLSTEIASNEQVIGISHPRGDFKRVSLGRRTRDVAIRFSSGERMPANIGYQVSWFQGAIQGGSSGSPLFATVDGRPYLVGSLSAGPNVEKEDSDEVCQTTNLVGSYGRFSAAFPFLQSFLTSTTAGNGSVAPNMASLSATPNPLALLPDRTSGRVNLSWHATGVTQVQIRIGSPSGPAMTGIEAPIGSAMTGDWVTNGMNFYLQDASDGNSSGTGKTLAAVRVDVSPASRDPIAGVIAATPNPVALAPGQTSGTAKVTWQAVGVSSVQVRIDSPTGPAMTGVESPSGSATTGDWVVDGTTFFLQDASSGDSSGATKTLATVRVQVR